MAMRRVHSEDWRDDGELPNGGTHEVVDGVSVSSFRVDQDGNVEWQPITAADRELARVFAAGIFTDPEWEATLAALDEIDRSSKPSPPLEDV